ncbi:MAG: MFS transporter [Lachnospiraceae bacterium]|nr:MFS transporter [Lachnospiraceae bacterium]
MLRKKIDALDLTALFNGLVFYAPVALLVRTKAGINVEQFFMLQAVLSMVIFGFEIPAGKITDRIGYRNTLVMAQMLLFVARSMLLVAFLQKSLVLFYVEAIIEGMAACFSSGTQSAYLYTMLPSEEFLVKTAHVGNCGTVGFLISTVAYAGIYAMIGVEGLLVATVGSSFLGCVVSLGIPKEYREGRQKQEKPAKGQKTRGLLLRKETAFVVLILSCVSMGFLLVNFFYVEKLMVCGLKEEWMSPIILGYSVVELLAEKILAKVDEKHTSVAFAICFCMAGGAMLLFGWASQPILVILLMLLLPLLITVPSYIFEEVQNRLVDKMGLGEKRAEVLSVFNMGVNLLEVVTLFAAAALSGLGSSACFFAVGVLMLVLGAASIRALQV